MGKIRIAQANGQPIPEGWATDAQGHPTTSAAEAIAGMLLPAAGPKGFGLAVAIDLLCGVLSGGAFGAAVQPLYGDPATPYNCAHAFIAIDASRTGGGAGIGTQVGALAQEIRGSQRTDPAQPIYAPGDLERARRAAQNGRCMLAASLVQQLNQEAQQAGIAARLAT
jgi:LDH2 family malate/lactate/ureidoglycolate dehydrogenase